MISQAMKIRFVKTGMLLIVVLACILPGVAQARQYDGFVKGDAVQLQAFPDTSNFFKGTYKIDDSGFVILPMIGKLRIESMTVAELERYLDTAYLRFLRYPNIQAQPLMRLSFIGGFHTPGLFYVNPRVSVWDALALTGGPMRDDGLQKTRWQRGNKVISDGIVSLIRSGVSLEGAGIESGDVFAVTTEPKRSHWEVFTTGVIPVISIAVTALSAAATVYFSYQVYKGGH